MEATIEKIKALPWIYPWVDMPTLRLVVQILSLGE